MGRVENRHLSPRVLWFAPSAAETNGCDGCHYKGEGAVWLRSDLHGWRLVEVALHETAHAARDAREMPNTETLVERDTQELLTAYVHERRYGW